MYVKKFKAQRLEHILFSCVFFHSAVVACNLFNKFTMLLWINNRFSAFCRMSILFFRFSVIFFLNIESISFDKCDVDIYYCEVKKSSHAEWICRKFSMRIRTCEIVILITSAHAHDSANANIYFSFYSNSVLSLKKNQQPGLNTA